VKVTTKDGPDAPEATVESESLDALRKDHPDLAKRLEGVLPKGGVRRWVLEWPPRAWQGGGKAAEDPSAVRGPLLRDGERRAERGDAPFDLPGPVLGIGWDPVPEVLRDQLDVPEGGMVVASVAPGSLAERLGLRRNDVLLRVADRPVAGPLDVRKALESVPEGGKVTAEILRKGRRETVSAAR
jgi:hypothetical protein